MRRQLRAAHQPTLTTDLTNELQGKEPIPSDGRSQTPLGESRSLVDFINEDWTWTLESEQRFKMPSGITTHLVRLTNKNSTKTYVDTWKSLRNYPAKFTSYCENNVKPGANEDESVVVFISLPL
jgi:hypothetical protein